MVDVCIFSLGMTNTPTWGVVGITSTESSCTCQQTWRHRRLETERWPPLKSINRNPMWLVIEQAWHTKFAVIGWTASDWLTNYHSAIFGFQLGRRSWPRRTLAAVWLASHVSREYLILYLWLRQPLKFWVHSHIAETAEAREFCARVDYIKR